MEQEANGMQAREGVVMTEGGEFCLSNHEEGWLLPLIPGVRFEVWAFGDWHAVTMCCGGYHGRYLQFGTGGCVRPAVCMRGWCVR